MFAGAQRELTKADLDIHTTGSVKGIISQNVTSRPVVHLRLEGTDWKVIQASIQQDAVMHPRIVDSSPRGSQIVQKGSV
jgi:hypothetical protein